MMRSVLFYGIVALHWIVIIGNLTAFLILPFIEPFWIALPIMSFIALITFSKELVCPLTMLENRFRKSAGQPEIKAFIRHYLIKPWRRKVVHKRRAKQQIQADSTYDHYKDEWSPESNGYS